MVHQITEIRKLANISLKQFKFRSINDENRMRGTGMRTVADIYIYNWEQLQDRCLNLGTGKII